MKNYIPSLAIATLLGLPAIAQENSNSNSVKNNKEKMEEAEAGQYKTKDKIADQYKMLTAKGKLDNRDFNGALSLYSEILTKNPKDASLNYRIGECYLGLNNITDAVTYFETAQKLNPAKFKDIHLSLGKSYHIYGDIDKAIEEYELYKSKLNASQLKNSDVVEYIEQCKLAKEMMANPVDVTVTNMGEEINSVNDDYAPSISADGKTLIFTSRRPDTKGGMIDVEGDYKYFEDIYISTLDVKTNTWNEAEPARGSLNSEGHDACLNIAPSGKEIFVYRNNEDTRSGDIFVSKLSANGKWGAPKTMGPMINSSYFESSASLSPDGSTLYFVSERKGGVGNGDIYVAKKINKTEWGEPVNIGPTINTVEDEVSCFIHPDGKTLFFSSRGHRSMGGYDIFKSVYENGKWSVPENVGYPINTVDDDIHFTLSADNKTGYYDTYSLKGMGERDIYKIDLSRYNIMEKDARNKKFNPSAEPVLSILKGMVTNSNEGQFLEAEITVSGENGEVIAKTMSNTDNGEYFFTLAADKKYQVSVAKDGYTENREVVSLLSDKNSTYTQIKNFVLERAK
jgi:tetratricopeptide (TPR) repeat protein